MVAFNKELLAFNKELFPVIVIIALVFLNFYKAYCEIFSYLVLVLVKHAVPRKSPIREEKVTKAWVV